MPSRTFADRDSDSCWASAAMIVMSKETDELLGEDDAEGQAVTREKNRYNWEERNASL